MFRTKSDLEQFHKIITVRTSLGCFINRAQAGGRMHAKQVKDPFVIMFKITVVVEALPL